MAASDVNPYRGLPCKICGKTVKSKEPAQMHTDVQRNERWVVHLDCLPVFRLDNLT